MPEYEREFEQLSEEQKLFMLCSEAGLKLVEKGQYFYNSWYRKRKRDATFMQRIHNGSERKRDTYKRMDLQEYEIWPCLQHKGLQS